MRVGGGDGFYTQNDPSDWRVMYSESQDGNTNRLEFPSRTVSIRPRPGGGRGAAPAPQTGGETPLHSRQRRQRSSGSPLVRTSCCQRPARPTASTGAHRSSCRRTIRARSISGPIDCSGPTIAATPGRHRRTSRTTSDGTIGRSWASRGPRRWHLNTMAPRPTATSSRSASLRSSRRALGRHQRRQRAGQPRWRRHLEERCRQRQGRAERSTSRASKRRTSTAAPPTSRSMVIAPTITNRKSSSRRISARRGRPSRATCPKVTSTSSGKIRRTAISCMRIAASISRSTVAGNGNGS